MNKSTLVIILVSLLVIISSVTLLPAAAVSTGQGNCGSGYVYKDENSPFSYSGNQIIGEVKIKAGSAQSTDGNQCTVFTQDGSNGCYQVTGLGTTQVTVVKVGQGPSCKDISHVEFYASYPSVTPSPSPSEKPSPTPKASPSVRPSPSVVPSPSPEVSATPEASASPEASPTPEDSASPTPETSASATPEASPSETPAASPSPTPETNPSPTPTPGVGGSDVQGTSTSSNSTSSNQGQILSGATTLAAAGSVHETVGLMLLIAGTVTFILSLYGIRQTYV